MTRPGPDGDPAADALATIRDLLLGADEGRTGATFVRGLTLGALLGAAVAGSAIWQRRQQRPHRPATAEPHER